MSGRGDHGGSGDSWPPGSDADWIAWLAAPDDEAPHSPAVGTPTASHTTSQPTSHAPAHPPRTVHDQGHPRGRRAAPASDAEWIAWLAQPDEDAPRSPAVGTPAARPSRPPRSRTAHRLRGPGAFTWPDPSPPPGGPPPHPHARPGPATPAAPAPSPAPPSPPTRPAGPPPDRRPVGPGSASNWLPWLTEGPVDRAGDDLAGLEPPVPPRRLTPADLQTDFGPVPPPTAPDPFAYDDPFPYGDPGHAASRADVAVTEEIPLVAEAPLYDDALPLLTRWHRVGWVLRDLVLLVVVALAVAGAWAVLVELRGPDPSGATDRLAQSLDRAVAASLRAERVASFGTWFVNVTATLVVGGVVFRSLVGTAQSRALGWSPVRVIRRAAVVGVVASLAVLPFRAAAIAGTGRVAMTDPATLEFVATTKVGTAALLRVAGLLLAAFAVAAPAVGPMAGPDHEPHRRGRPHRPADGSALDHLFGAAGALLILASYGWVGHPQAADGPVTLLVLSQLIHVLAVSTWFGGVMLLYLQIRAGRRAGAVRTSAEVVERFSTVAGLSLALTAATGVALARSQIASVDALTSTPYGQALALKLGLVALVVVLGGYNKVSVVPRVVEMHGPAAWRSLHRTLLAEAAIIAAGVLLATTAMTSGGL